ncbi:MAG: cytochrome c maturation protein CcmE [Bacteroidales bacterium]|nr:cytochrome c maturation protein CcmE [Bacteroidales bacterium]
MKKTHIAALIFVVIAIAAIITTVYDADTYASFAEAREHPGRQFHIIGELNPEKPIEERIEQNTLTFSFYMLDRDGEESKVIYFGGKPQDFEKLDQIVLVGSYNHDNFVASQLLLKCPSKYNEDEFADTAEY